MVTKLLSHVTHNTRMHCHKRDWLMVVALFAPPLEAWIRWVAPFYAFRKPNCAHLASDSVVDQATSSVLQAARCSWSSSSCAPNQLKIIRQKTKLKDPFDVHHDHEENSKKKSKSKTFLFLANKQGGPALAIFSCSKKYDPGASVVCILGMRCQSIAPKKAFGAS